MLKVLKHDLETNTVLLLWQEDSVAIVLKHFRI